MISGPRKTARSGRRSSVPVVYSESCRVRGPNLIFQKRLQKKNGGWGGGTCHQSYGVTTYMYVHDVILFKFPPSLLSWGNYNHCNKYQTSYTLSVTITHIDHQFVTGPGCLPVRSRGEEHLGGGGGGGGEKLILPTYKKRERSGVVSTS